MADPAPGPPEPDCDVLIAGAGPTGLTLALALRRLGVDCMVIDAGDGPRAEPRAAVVWPREAELLAAIGLGDALRQAARPLSPTTVFHGRRRLGELTLAGVASAFERPLVIEQHVLQGLLEAELHDAGGRVRWWTGLQDFAPAEDGIHAEVLGPEGAGLVRARWLVGCDGAHSLVRKRLGVAFVGRSSPNLEVVQVKADLDWPYDPARGALFLAPDHAMGAFPMPDGRRRFYCFKTIEAPNRTSAPTLDEIQRLIGAMMGRGPVELRDVDWLSRARFQQRIAARLRVGRVLLAGDAAHVWPAVGGHGMAVAILGACNLAWRLAAVIRGQGPVRLLDVYGDEQRAQAAAMIGKLRFDLFERPLPGPVIAGLAAVLPQVLRSRRAQAAIEGGLMSDLALHHRRSPMSRSRAAGGPRAGDRAPDVFLTCHGRPRRLHQLLSIRGWTLILPPAADADRIAARLAGRTPVRLVQATTADAEAWRALGGFRNLLLVRPDGYIGLVARPEDLEALDAYLDAWLKADGLYRRENRVSWLVMNSSRAGTPA